MILQVYYTAAILSKNVEDSQNEVISTNQLHYNYSLIPYIL